MHQHRLRVCMACCFAFTLFHAVNLQFLIHTPSVPKLWQPVEWVLNTPSHHRVHHARNYRRWCVTVL